MKFSLLKNVHVCENLFLRIYVKQKDSFAYFIVILICILLYKQTLRINVNDIFLSVRYHPREN